MTTSNTQFGASMNYSDLKDKHYELDVQESATRNQVDYDFPIHEFVVVDTQAYDDLVSKQEALIEARNEKYRKRREYSKIDKDLDAYYKRKSMNAKAKHEASNNIPVIFENSNMEDYESLVELLRPYGLTECEIRKAHVKALKSSINEFNGTFGGSLFVDEFYVHANEAGIPHLHARMLLDDLDGHGMPNGNLATFARKRYAEKNASKAMSELRVETDTILNRNLNVAVKELTQELELGYLDSIALDGYLTLTRKGTSFDDVEKMKISKNKEALAQREQELKEQERALKEARKLQANIAERHRKREQDIKEYEQKLDAKTNEINERINKSNADFKLKYDLLTQKEEGLKFERDMLTDSKSKLISEVVDKVLDKIKELGRAYFEFRPAKREDTLIRLTADELKNIDMEISNKAIRDAQVRSRERYDDKGFHKYPGR